MKRPALLQRWLQRIPGTAKPGLWWRDLSAVSSPGKIRMINGTRWLVFTGCKPHDCPDNKMVALFALHAEPAVGLISYLDGTGVTRRVVIGEPDSTTSACMLDLLKDEEHSISCDGL